MWQFLLAKFAERDAVKRKPFFHLERAVFGRFPAMGCSIKTRNAINTTCHKIYLDVRDGRRGHCILFTYHRYKTTFRLHRIVQGCFYTRNNRQSKV